MSSAIVEAVFMARIFVNVGHGSGMEMQEKETVLRLLSLPPLHHHNILW